MTNIEIVKTLVSAIEPLAPQDEAIKQAVLALLEKVKPEPTVKPEPKSAAPKKKGGRKSQIDWGKAEACRNAGWTYEKIADELGCSTVTVANHFRKEC